MNVKEETICRLCFRVADNDFQIIDEITREMFEVLLLKVNLDIIKDPIICKDCAEVVEKCFNFKSACNDTEKLLLSFSIDKNRGAFELKYVYKDGKYIETIDNNVMCRFCWSHLSGSIFVLLETLTTEVKFAEMLQVLMPEMDLDFIKNPVICRSCMQNLECYIKFIENCVTVEQKITEYFQNEDFAQAKLSDIQHFLYNSCSKVGYTQIHVIKREMDVLENTGETHSEAYAKLIKDEGVGKLIKDEEGVDVKVEEIYISETNQVLSTKNILEAKHNTSPKRCELTHDNIIEVKMRKCSVCTYETNDKSNFRRHTLIHKNITKVKTYKCETCTYQTNDKSNLRRHMLIHKNIEVKMYKCATCSYETIRKNHLVRHVLMHKDITEVEMYKCSICTYETKYKDNLKGHLLNHKDITEVKLYYCSMCTYKTKRKSSLKSHMLNHKDITEVEMYNCSMCTFTTKLKGSLRRHIRRHHNK